MRDEKDSFTNGIKEAAIGQPPLKESVYSDFFFLN